MKPVIGRSTAIRVGNADQNCFRVVVVLLQVRQRIGLSVNTDLSPHFPRLSISLVFATAAVFLFAELAFGRRLRVVYAMLHRFCCAKEGEDRLEVVIG